VKIDSEQTQAVLSETMVLQDAAAGSSLADVAQILYRHKRLTSLQLPATVDFRELVTLRVLSLSHNALCDISPVAELPALVDLNVNHNQITDLGPAFQCESLEVLFAANNRVSSIAGLELQHLRHLSLFRNDLSDLAAVVQVLEPLSSLRRFDIGGNPCAEDQSQCYGIVRTLAQLSQLDGEEVGDIDRALAEEFFMCAREAGFNERPCSAKSRPKTAPAVSAPRRRRQRGPSASPSRSPSTHRSGSRSPSASRKQSMQLGDLPGEAASTPAGDAVAAIRHMTSQIEAIRLQIQTVQVDCENLRRQISGIRAQEPKLGVASLRERKQELEEENRLMHECAVKNQQLKEVLAQKEAELSAKRASKGLPAEVVHRPGTSRPRSAAGSASAVAAVEVFVELSGWVQNGPKAMPQGETAADWRFKNHLLRRELAQTKSSIDQLSADSYATLLGRGLEDTPVDTQQRRPRTAAPRLGKSLPVDEHEQRFAELTGQLHLNEQNLQQMAGVLRRTEVAAGLQRPMTTGHLH
jgi:hypothetical protein